MCSDKKCFKILFGVPEGEYIARQFASVAGAIPEAECRFLGFSWCTGRVLRKMGFDYSHIPWQFIKSQIPDVIPPVYEFISRGFRHDTVPESARQTLGTLAIYVEKEIEHFQPDIIVYGPIEHAVCFMLDQKAKAKGIPTIGIQTSFVANHFIAQSQGFFWEDFIRTAELPENFNYTSPEAGPSHPSVIARSIARENYILSMGFWLRGIERTLRFISRRVSFDTWESLKTKIASKFAPREWFPDLEPLHSLEDIPSGAVLVALHQPSLPWTSPTWVDLVRFALETTPEDIPIIIRPHPGELARQIPEEIRSALCSRGVRTSRAFQDPDLAALLQRCRAMLTLTSSTGIEALRNGVPVFTLGPAFYARPGLARFVTLQDAPMVREMIIHSEQFLPDAIEVAKLTTWILNECMVLAPELDSTSINSLPQRIRRAVKN